jgi:hypothetical protein
MSNLILETEMDIEASYEKDAARRLSRMTVPPEVHLYSVATRFPIE